MSNQTFVFPPPPPPPPKRSTDAILSPCAARGHGVKSLPGRGTHRGYHLNRESNVGSWGRGQGNGAGRGLRGGRGHAPHHTSMHGTLGSAVETADVSTPDMRSSPSLNTSQKRSHATAFAPLNQPRARPTAAPAVPSFNAVIDDILPPKPPRTSQQEAVPKPKKQNQLGLTPAKIEQESDAEDDVDEESSLAVRPPVRGLEFEYSGRVLSLRTAAEIAAWVAERRKRFPTQAKAEAAKKEAEEKKRKWEEQRKAKQEERSRAREQRERSKQEKALLGEKMLASNRDQEAGQTCGSVVDAAMQAKLRAEKLRRRALRAEQDLARAKEALRVAEARINDATSPEHSLLQAGEELATTADGSLIPPGRDQAVGSAPPDGMPESEQSQERLMALVEVAASENTRGSEGLPRSEAELISTVSDSSDLSESEETSSSGSSDSDSESAPEQLDAKQALPERGPPAKMAMTASNSGPRRICRNLTKYGRCRYGTSCRYSHDITEKNSRGRSKPGVPAVGSQRKGLWQVMVEKEQEEERWQLVQAIITLGERGVLDEPNGM